MTFKTTDVRHERLYQAMCEAMKTHGADLSAEELLATAANLVGKLIAHQDQRRWSSVAIMEMVGRNIEAGNAEALGEILQTEGNA